MADKIALVVAGDGYHPIEYSVPKRILEHSGMTIITVSDKPGTATAKDGTTTDVDVTLDQLNIDDVDAVFFIGGPGALEHLDNKTSYHILTQLADTKKPFGSICAATRILAKRGVIAGKRVTGWNDDGLLDKILEDIGATYVRKDVVVDGNIVTAIGPSAAQEFGAKVLGIMSHT